MRSPTRIPRLARLGAFAAAPLLVLGTSACQVNQAATPVAVDCEIFTDFLPAPVEQQTHLIKTKVWPGVVAPGATVWADLELPTVQTSLHDRSRVAIRGQLPAGATVRTIRIDKPEEWPGWTVTIVPDVQDATLYEISVGGPGGTTTRYRGVPKVHVVMTAPTQLGTVLWAPYETYVVETTHHFLGEKITCSPKAPSRPIGEFIVR